MVFKRIAYKICMIPAIGITGSAIAIAQMPPAQQQPQQPQQTMPSAQGTGQGSGAYPGTAPTGMDFGEKAFVSKALEGDQTEIEMGQLAQQKSQSNDVKQLAQKLASDHTQMSEKWLDPLAKQMDVSEPKGPSKKDKKMAEKMQAMSGAEFDSQYLTMMINDHKKDLKDFQDEAQVAQDPNVKQVAEQGAKIIEQHLQLIEQVAKNHNIDTGETAKSPSM